MKNNVLDFLESLVFYINILQKLSLITVIWSKYIYPKYFILGKTLYLIIKIMGQLEVELAKLHFGTIFVLRYEK